MDLINSIVKRGKLKKIKKMIDMPALLKAINATTKQGKYHGKEYWDLCPNPNHKDHSPSWSINIDPEHDRFGVHNCFACGYGGNFITLTAEKLSQSTGKKVENTDAVKFIIDLFTLDKFDEDALYELILEERQQMFEDAEKEKEFSHIILPEEYQKLNNKSGIYHQYLTSDVLDGGRGLNDALLYKYNIGYCKTGLYHDRIIIPFIQEGELISFLARSILPTIKTEKKDRNEYKVCPECKTLNTLNLQECKKCDHDLTRYVVKKARSRYPKGSTMELMLWPFDDLDYTLDYVIPVEGAMDKLRLESLGYKNVLTLFGNKVSDYQVKLLKKFEKKVIEYSGKRLRVFLFPDADAGGDTLIDFANVKLKYEFDTFVVELPWQDIDPLDPGSATPKQIRTSFNKAEKLYKVHARKFK